MQTDDSQFDTRSSLLRRLADSRNEGAWTEFLERYQPMILRWCRTAQLSEDESQEMLGRVLLKLARKMSGFHLDRSRGRFRGWLKTVVQHEILDYWRSLARRPTEEYSLQDSSSRLQRVVDPASLEQLSEQLSQGIDAELDRVQVLIEATRSRVGETTWLAFWKTVVDGLTAREAAAELDLTVTAVSQAKYRVSKMLREGVQDLRGAADASESDESSG